jgi:hypothetical protein
MNLVRSREVDPGLLQSGFGSIIVTQSRYTVIESGSNADPESLEDNSLKYTVPVPVNKK